MYRLATVTHRTRTFPVLAVQNLLIDVNYGYEFYKREKGVRNFFKARHDYTMLDILEEWELFDAECDRMAEFFVSSRGKGNIPASLLYRQDDVRLRPPVMYPNKILNAGSNYYDHALEMGAAVPDRNKHEPYFFYKGSRHNVIGNGEAASTWDKSGSRCPRLSTRGVHAA